MHKTHAEAALATRHPEMGRCTPANKAPPINVASLVRSFGPMSRRAATTVCSGFEAATSMTGPINRSGFSKTDTPVRTTWGNIS